MVSFRYTPSRPDSDICEPFSFPFLLERIYPAPPSVQPRSEQDVIQKTLNAIGVTYSHMNDDILAPSRIEAERTKQSLVVRDVFFLSSFFLYVDYLAQENSKEEEPREGERQRVACGTMATEEAAS